MGSRLQNLSRKINNFVWRLSAVFFIAMLLIVIFQILARYIFNSPPPWTAEAARYCMIWGGMLGSSVAFYFNKDPRLFEPPKNKSKIVNIMLSWARSTAVLLFIVPILLSSWGYLNRSAGRTTEILRIPSVFVTSAIPISILLIFFHTIVHMIDSFSNGSEEA